MQLCYESFKKSFENESSTLSFEDLQTFLWIIFSIEDVNEDKEVKDIEILSYGKEFFHLKFKFNVFFLFLHR